MRPGGGSPTCVAGRGAWCRPRRGSGSPEEGLRAAAARSCRGRSAVRRVRWCRGAPWRRGPSGAGRWWRARTGPVPGCRGTRLAGPEAGGGRVLRRSPRCRSREGAHRRRDRRRAWRGPRSYGRSRVWTAVRGCSSPVGRRGRALLGRRHRRGGCAGTPLVRPRFRWTCRRQRVSFGHRRGSRRGRRRPARGRRRARPAGPAWRVSAYRWPMRPCSGRRAHLCEGRVSFAVRAYRRSVRSGWGRRWRSCGSRVSRAVSAYRRSVWPCSGRRTCPCASRA